MTILQTHCSFSTQTMTVLRASETKRKVSTTKLLSLELLFLGTSETTGLAKSDPIPCQYMGKSDKVGAFREEQLC